MEDLVMLLGKAKKGDKDAFGKIYSYFYKKIYRFIYYQIYNNELAEDLTQNTFMKAWRALTRFNEGKGTFQAYLFTIARNLVTDHYRKKQEVSIDDIDEIESFEYLEESIDSNSEQEALRRALDMLDSNDKQLIILRFFEELSFSEVGQIAGFSEGAARVKVHRILKKLKSLIGEEDVKY